jgi:hypothetical protein
VFDDAHTAEYLLREHFSLRISKERLEEVYLAIAKEFADYFYAVGCIVFSPLAQGLLTERYLEGASQPIRGQGRPAGF